MARNHETKSSHLRPYLIYRSSHGWPDLLLRFHVLVLLAEHDVVIVLLPLLSVFVVVVVVQWDYLKLFFRKSRTVRVVQERFEVLVIFQPV